MDMFLFTAQKSDLLKYGFRSSIKVECFCDSTFICVSIKNQQKGINSKMGHLRVNTQLDSFGFIARHSLNFSRE